MMDELEEGKSPSKEPPAPAKKAAAKPKKPAAKPKKAAIPAKAEGQALTLEASAENIAIELRKKLDELLEHATALLAGGEAILHSRSTAMQLDEFAKREGFSLSDLAKAGDTALELRIKADIDTIKSSSGVDIMSNGIENFSVEECARVFEMLDRDFGLESDVVRDKLISFKEMVLRRHNEILDTTTQVSPTPPVEPPPESKSQPELEIVIEEEEALPESEPEVPLVHRPPKNPVEETKRVTHEDIEGEERRTLLAEQLATAKEERRKRWLKFMGFGALALLGVLTLFLFVAFSAWPTPVADDQDALATEPIPDGVEPSVTEPAPEPAPSITTPQSEPAAHAVEPAPTTSPVFTCIPFTETNRCRASGDTVTEEMMDTCTVRQTNPHFTREEHPFFWDCGTVFLDLDSQGRQDTCVPDCCFCRYE